jgi:beta-lactamase class A
MRLLGLLPNKTPVAHKTGTLTGFACDVGIITLPFDAGSIAISVYIKDSNKELVHLERIIAEVARTIYDYYLFN